MIHMIKPPENSTRLFSGGFRMSAHHPSCLVNSFRIISTGIMVTASRMTAIHPVIPKGTQLNIFPIHLNIDDQRLYKKKKKKYFQETGIFIHPLKNAESLIPHIEPVEQRTDDEQDKITGQMLLF